MASLPKSYKDIVQNFFIGTKSIILNQVLATLRENDRFTERHEREEKKGSNDALFDEGFRGRAMEKGNQARGCLKRKVTIVTRSVTFARRRGTFK